MQYTSGELKKNANDCAQLANEARSDAERARYTLMEAAWLELANAQAWLDGEHNPLTPPQGALAIDSAKAATRADSTDRGP